MSQDTCGTTGCSILNLTWNIADLWHVSSCVPEFLPQVVSSQSPAGIQNPLAKLIPLLLQIELTMVLRNCVYHSGLCRKAGRRTFILGTRAVVNASMATGHQQARLKGTLTSKFAFGRLHTMHFCCCNLHQCLDSVFMSLKKNIFGWQSRLLDVFIYKS